MATFVLVHGAWHGGWCWKKIAPSLRAAGYEVYTPTLTGLGDRSHLLSPAVNLSMHITDIVNLLFYEDLADVLLVGHSYGGLVIDGVAEAAAERLKRLIYLDAVIADDGECLFDACSLDIPDMRERWTGNAIDVNGTLAYPGYPGMLDEWEITDPADIAWMKPRLVPQPLAAATEPLRVPAHRATQIGSSFIFCAGSANPRHEVPALVKKAQARGCDYDELATEHDAMVTAPHQLASLLLEIANAS